MMRKFLSCLLSAILIFAYAPAIPAENHFDLSLEALPGAKPEVHVLPLPDKELPLIRALVGGKPVDALRLQGEEYRDVPAFYCLVLGETAQLRFADSDKPYLYVPVYELLKVAAEQQEKPLLIEIKAPAQAHLSMSGQMGMVDLGHLKEVPPDPADQESAIQEPNTGTGVTDKPAITQKPTDGQTPVVTKKPVITIKPVITKKPVITEKPVITNKPVTSEDAVCLGPGFERLARGEASGVILFGGLVCGKLIDDRGGRPLFLYSPHGIMEAIIAAY